jgi:DNA-binding transcriptional MocR family regulator
VALTAAARDVGVGVSQGSRYFATERPGSWVRFNFAAAADPVELTEAARRLAAL